MKKIALLFVFFFPVCISVFAQKTRIIGKVTNNRNENLVGVTVRIGGSAVARTDIEGRYSVPAEFDKKYNVNFSYIGYAEKIISDVAASRAGEDIVLDIMLEEAGKALESVTVKSSGRAGVRGETVNAMIAFQKNTNTVASVISAEAIRRTPDKNTGEVLRRVSGASVQDNKFVIVRGLSDRYNSAMINGALLPSTEPDKKVFSFDIIPSNLIDNIVLLKTAVPDVTGEFSGGLVQINTIDMPSKSQLSFGVGLGYNSQSTFKDFISNERGTNDWLGLDNQRMLPSGYPKKYLEFNKLSQADQIAIAKSFNDKVYKEHQSTAGPVQQYNLAWSNISKGKNGGAFGSVIGVTYRKSKLLYAASKSLFDRAGSPIFDYNDNQNKFSVNWGAVANFAWTKGNHKIAFKNLFNQLLEDNYYHRFGINTDNYRDISLRSSVLNQRSLYASQLEGTHQVTPLRIKLNWNLNYAYNNKQQPDLRVQTYGRSLGTADPYNIILTGNNSNRFFSDLKDHTVGYAASALIPFNLGGLAQSFKIGGSGSIRLRDFQAIILAFKDPSNHSLLTLPYDQIFSAANFSPTGYELRTDLQNPQNKYFGISALSAGYFMFDNKISQKVRLVWGSRFENFQQFLKSNAHGTDKAQIVNAEKFDVLPSFNMTISPNRQTNIRLAGSLTIARPEFREIAPFEFFDFEQIASIAGEPDLKRSRTTNVDIRYELYPAPGELLSLGTFYKFFTDPIELRLNSASAATRRSYQFQNAEHAYVYGIEAEFRKNLSFLNKGTAWLENLFINGNASILFSEVSLGGIDASGNKLPSTKRPLQGQSPYLINAGIQYDGESGTNFSILYNRIGQRLSLVGNRDFNDIYEKPRDLVDFQISQKIMKKNGELRLTISDIFNQPYVTYENRNDKKVFESNVDKQFSSYKPGTTITLGFTYNLELNKK